MDKAAKSRGLERPNTDLSPFFAVPPFSCFRVALFANHGVNGCRLVPNISSDDVWVGRPSRVCGSKENRLCLEYDDRPTIPPGGGEQQDQGDTRAQSHPFLFLDEELNKHF